MTIICQRLLGVLIVFSIHHLSAASVGGLVLDSDQRPVAEAKLTVVHLETGQKRFAESNSAGRFRLEQLTPGRFLLSVEIEGFESQPMAFRLAAGDEREERIVVEPARVRTEVVVTAEASPVSADTVSRALDVVRESDWEARGASTLSEAVQQTPGLRVQNLGGPGSFTRLVMRGLRGQDTAITVDGLRFRDAATTQGDASSFLENLMLTNSQRVEVLRGSGSAMYGSNAIGGVINVVSAEAHDRWRANLTTEGGGLGFARGHFRAGGPLSRTVSFSSGFQHTNVSSGIDGQDPFRNSSLQTAATWRPASRISLTGRLYGADAFVGLNDSPFAGPAGVLPAFGRVAAQPVSLSEQRRIESGFAPRYLEGANLVPNLNDPDSHRASRFAATALLLSHQILPRLAYRVSYQNLVTRRLFEDGPAGVRFEPMFRSEDKFRGQTDTMQARVDFSASARWRFGGGYEVEREDYQGRSFNEAPQPYRYSALARQTSHALIGYAEGSMLQDRLHISLAARMQRFTLRQPLFDGGLTPYPQQRLSSPPDARTVDAGLSWFMPRSRTKLRAHAGNGYRAPSLYERYGASFFEGGFTALGDPRLQPDRTLSLDAGIDQYLLRDRVRVGATQFYTDLREVIAFDSSGFLTAATDPFRRSSGYINTSGATARGVELQTEAALPRRIRLTGSYTYTNSLQRRSTVRDNDFFRSPLIVPHQFTSAVTVPVSRRFDVTASAWMVSSHAIILSRRAFLFEGGRKLDVAGSYLLPFEKVAFRLQARASNLLNSRYLENGFRTPGLWATAGFNLSF